LQFCRFDLSVIETHKSGRGFGKTEEINLVVTHRDPNPVGTAERNYLRPNWRRASLMLAQKFERSENHQINLLTIQEVADWAKVSTKTVYRWISDNKILAIRLGNRPYRIPEKPLLLI